MSALLISRQRCAGQEPIDAAAPRCYWRAESPCRLAHRLVPGLVAHGGQAELQRQVCRRRSLRQDLRVAQVEAPAERQPARRQDERGAAAELAGRSGDAHGGAHLGRKRIGPDERDPQRARTLALAGQRLGLWVQVGTGLGDDPRGVLGNDANIALRARQRALEVEHRPHERLGGKRLREHVAREAAADDVLGHGARALELDEDRFAGSPQPNVPAIDVRSTGIASRDQRAEPLGIADGARQGIVLDRF